MSKSLIFIYLLCGLLATASFLLLDRIWGIAVFIIFIAGGIFILHQNKKNK